jgi:D-glycero-alpha-D-manno-heptose-7-phosphate kinase
VLNVAIDRFCHVTIELRQDSQLSVNSADIQKTWVGEAPRVLGPETGAPSLMRGVYNRVVKDFNNDKPISVNITSYADAPTGSGLGTSSSMVVTLLKAFSELLSLKLTEYELASLAFQIERTDLDLAGGKQDHYAAAFGGTNYIEFKPSGDVVVNQLKLSRRTIAELESSLLLYFTGVSRESAHIIQDQRRSVSQNSDQQLRAMHELKRLAVEMKDALLLENIDEFAELLHVGWQHKKHTSSKVSNKMIDEIYDVARAAGAKGGKVSGAGGGGFMMFVSDPSCRPAVERAVGAFKGVTDFCSISNTGAEAWSIPNQAN